MYGAAASRTARSAALLALAVVVSGCASTRVATLGTLANGDPLVTLVVSEDRQVVQRECQGVLALGLVLGCQMTRQVPLPAGPTVRAIKIVRYTDVLPSRFALDIDVHELCHAVASLQGIHDPCHADGQGAMILPSASRRLLAR